jgi:hypothetical protein
METELNFPAYLFEWSPETCLVIPTSTRFLTTEGYPYYPK